MSLALIQSRRAVAALVVLAASACTSAAAAPAPPPPGVASPAPAAAVPAAAASVRIVQRLQAAEEGMPILRGDFVAAARGALAARGVRLRVLRFGPGARRVSSQWPEPGAPLPADGVAVVWAGVPPAPPSPGETAGEAPVSGSSVPAAPAAPAGVPAPAAGIAPTVPLPGASYEPPPTPQPPKPQPPAAAAGQTPASDPATPATELGDEPPGGGVLTGTASWYGPGFEARRTACGGRFDPDALTLASRELACGTTVTVTATSGRTVEATVTDYGPAAWTNRRFDLSRATFAAVADLGAGTAHVRVEVR